MHFDGQEYGPIDESVLHDWVKQGRVRGDSMVWRQGMADWTTAESAQPNWFLNQRANGVSRTTQAQGTEASGELNAYWVTETCSKLTWLYFLAISIITIAVLTCVGGGIFFIRGIAIMRDSRALGENLLIGGIMSMIYAGMTLISGIILVRYAIQFQFCEQSQPWKMRSPPPKTISVLVRHGPVYDSANWIRSLWCAC